MSSAERTRDRRDEKLTRPSSSLSAVPRVCTLVGGGGEFRSAAESSERVDSRASNGVSTPVKVRASSNSPLKPSPPSTARPTGTAASSTMHPFIPQLALHQLRSPSVGRSSSTPLTESSTPHPFGGLGESGFVDGPLSSCRFSDPTSIALQLHPVSRAVEAVLVADTGNHAVRRVDLVRGSVTTVACRTTMRPTPPTDANEVCADHVAAGASTAAVAASPFPILLPLHSPADLLLDPSSNGSYLLVADSGNHIIRKLQLLDGIERKRGTSVRWAGGGGDLAAGVTKLGEENEGDEEEAEEEEDQTVTGSSNGTTTDDTPPPTGRRRMRESDAALESSSRPGTASTSRSSSSHLPSASTVSALSARFSHPSGMCWDTSQRVWLCDRVNGKVKRVDTTGRVTSFAARTRDELGVQASRPQCIIQDARGDIVFTDRENHCVKKIAPDGTTSSSGSSRRRRTRVSAVFQPTASHFVVVPSLSLSPLFAHVLFARSSLSLQAPCSFWPVVLVRAGFGMVRLWRPVSRRRSASRATTSRTSSSSPTPTTTRFALSHRPESCEPSREREHR